MCWYGIMSQEDKTHINITFTFTFTFANWRSVQSFYWTPFLKRDWFVFKLYETIPYVRVCNKLYGFHCMYGFMWIVIISIALILIVMKQECAQFVEERTVIKDNELGSKAIRLDCLRLNSSDEAEDEGCCEYLSFKSIQFHPRTKVTPRKIKWTTWVGLQVDQSWLHGMRVIMNKKIYLM